MKKYFIGIDNGGTVIKSAIYCQDGEEIVVAAKNTPIIIKQPGFSERDMNELWKENCSCVRGALNQSKIPAEQIAGVAVCGHGKGLYAWGDGKPAGNGIVSTDNRAWEYPEKWRNSGVFDKLYPQLCQQLIPAQQASILAWLKDHDRDMYDGIKWIFSVKDYIRFRMTGEAYSEITAISGSGLMDIKNGCFDKVLLNALGIGEVFNKLPPLKNSFDVCGLLTDEAAELTGLNAGTPVAGGMFDIDACAVAMDITTPEKLCTITGTWSINEFISRKPVTGTAIAMNSFFAIPGYYLIEECSPTSAGNIEWFLNKPFHDLAVPEGKSKYQYINELVDSVNPSECDIFYLPFLYGSNAHPLAKASFVGLTSFHENAHLLRAVFEGVAFSHKTHIDKLLSVREAPAAIRLAGGVVNSSVWVQIFADVLEIPIETVHGVKELGALGAAMAAAVSAGFYSDYSEAAEHMVSVNEPVYPDKMRSEIYKNKFRKYKAVSNALDSVWEKY